MTGVGNLLAGLWVGVAIHLWQTSLVLVPLLMLGHMARNGPHRLASSIAWLALAKMLVPLALVGPIINRIVAPLLNPTGSIGRASELLYPGVLASSGAVPPAPWAAWVLLGITLAWAAGVWWRVVRSWMRRPAVLMRASISPEALPEVARGRLTTAIGATGIDPASIRVIAGPVGPCVFGLRHRKIVLPLAAVTELPAEELRGILLHEQAHLRRRDPLVEVALGLTMVLFYFYPPLWLISRWLRESAEYACDEAAVRAGISPGTLGRAVARTLSLEVAAAYGPAVLAFQRSSSLQARFRRLDEPWRYVTMTKHRIVLLIAVASALLLSVAVAMIARDVPTRSDAQPASEAESSPKTLLPDLETMPQMVADSYVAPEYPDRAWRASIEGHVLLSALVRADGTVDSVQVVEGIADYPEFGASAVAAACQWKFKPGTHEGKFVDVWVKIPVAFKLDNKASGVGTKK